MYPTFATSVYNRTKSTVESRVNSSLQETLGKYEKKLQALDAEKKAGKYQFTQRNYEQKKGKIMRNLKAETEEIREEADRYMSNLGLKEKKLSSSHGGSPSSLSQIGMRSWTRSAAGGRLKGLFSRSGTDFSHVSDPSSDWNPFLGYIGPPSAKGYSAAMEMSVSGKLEASREEELGQCFKLSMSPKSYDSIQQALLYLKLRSDGCSKEKSMVYSVKRRCMTDSTMTRDGPACHRTIQMGDNRITGPNWKGWQLHPPQLKVERRFQPIEENLDQREYELLAKEFERLTDKQDRQREGMDFDEGDKDRERYFHALQIEWGKRERRKKVSSPVLHKAKVSAKVSAQVSAQVPAKVSAQVLNLSIPVVNIPIKPDPPTKPETVQTSVTVKSEPMSPGQKEDTIEADLSTKESLHEAEVKLIDPTKIEEFGMGSLIIRNVVPKRVTLPPQQNMRQLTRTMTMGLRTIREIREETGEVPSLSNKKRFSVKSEEVKDKKTVLKTEGLNSEEIQPIVHKLIRVRASAAEIGYETNDIVSHIQLPPMTRSPKMGSGSENKQGRKKKRLFTKKQTKENELISVRSAGFVIPEIAEQPFSLESSREDDSLRLPVRDV